MRHWGVELVCHGWILTFGTYCFVWIIVLFEWIKRICKEISNSGGGVNGIKIKRWNMFFERNIIKFRNLSGGKLLIKKY